MKTHPIKQLMTVLLHIQTAKPGNLVIRIFKDFKDFGSFDKSNKEKAPHIS